MSFVANEPSVPQRAKFLLSDDVGPGQGSQGRLDHINDELHRAITALAAAQQEALGSSGQRPLSLALAFLHQAAELLENGPWS